jgi:Tfp pilus assembly protein PilX
VRTLATRAARRGQQGVILFVALIVLVAMSLAGIALMRSVDTNVLIAGNLAFRQGATLAGDRAFEDTVDGARKWLLDPVNKDNLLHDKSVGYYWANWQSSFKPLDSAFWDDANTTAWKDLKLDTSGNRVRYVIHRMCELAGDQNQALTNCIKVPSADTVSSTKGTVGYGTQALQTATSTYYRVTVRIDGPRNTVSYVQAMLN